MPDVATLLREFVDELSAGQQPDAVAFIERAESTEERKELAGLIDLSLTLAPEEMVHPRDRSGNFISPVSSAEIERVVDAGLAPARGWQVVIPELLGASGKSVESLAAEVVGAAGFEASAENVSVASDWLADMARGVTNAREISRAALAAVAAALGTAVDRFEFEGSLPGAAAANFRAEGRDNQELTAKLDAITDVIQAEADAAEPNPVDAWFQP